MDAALATARWAVGFRIPMAQPRWTFILLGINIAVFLAMTVFGALNGLGWTAARIGCAADFGAMQNQLIAQGDYHRLLTSMFLHIGLIHLLFNSYALYVVGQDVERLYGSSALPDHLLAQRPGRQPGVLRPGRGRHLGRRQRRDLRPDRRVHRLFLPAPRDLRPAGQAQLRSLLMLAGINLVLGFTIPGIDNLAHMGGLVFGALLGWLLAPKYQAPSVFTPTADAA